MAECAARLRSLADRPSNAVDALHASAGASPAKLDVGGKIELRDADQLSAELIARRRAQDVGDTYDPPNNDIGVAAGHARCAAEENSVTIEFVRAALIQQCERLSAKRAAVILCGRNIAFETFRQIADRYGEAGL